MTEPLATETEAPPPAPETTEPETEPEPPPDVYTTMEADRSGGRLVYPVGTIIVKEAARPETDFIGLVATMRKVEEADPEHGDWVFIEWTRSSPDEPFQETASDAVCWNCHVGAQDTDWVWVHTLGVAR